MAIPAKYKSEFFDDEGSLELEKKEDKLVEKTSGLTESRRYTLAKAQKKVLKDKIKTQVGVRDEMNGLYLKMKSLEVDAGLGSKLIYALQCISVSIEKAKAELEKKKMKVKSFAVKNASTHKVMQDVFSARRRASSSDTEDLTEPTPDSVQ